MKLVAKQMLPVLACGGAIGSAADNREKGRERERERKKKRERGVVMRVTNLAGLSTRGLNFSLIAQFFPREREAALCFLAFTGRCRPGLGDGVGLEVGILIGTQMLTRMK